jgi:hypothetical protein
MGDSPEAAENVAKASSESDSAKDEKENGLGVKPAVKKKAEKPADNNGRDENEGQLHGNGGLIGDVFGFFTHRRR